MLFSLEHGGGNPFVVVEEVVIRHVEDSIIGFDEADLLPPFPGPGRIVITPLSMITFRAPWVPHFGESVFDSSLAIFEIYDIKESVSMTRDQSISTSTSAAGRSHWVVVLGKESM